MEAHCKGGQSLPWAVMPRKKEEIIIILEVGNIWCGMNKIKVNVEA
jgi:hypothetical protein